MTVQSSDRDQVVVNTIKALSIDAVQAANSGHPGMPMGMADASSVLWRNHLTVDPTAPGFADRDRFILSPGHGSMLIYSLLHLSGYDVSLDEIKRFRQLESKTPGHPEVDITPGVEVTTGPLGQGFAIGVGMAMAAEFLAARFNREGFPIVDHMTFAIVSDGDLQEGITHEAGGLAGHLGLGRMVYLYDDNRITIEGSTDLSFTEDVTGRFESYGWQVLDIDGHDRAAVDTAIAAGRAETQRPTLIRCHTHIGHGSPNKQDKSSSHGSPLGVDEVAATKRGMGWPEDAAFLVPDEAREAFAGLRSRGAEKRAAWEAMFATYETAHPELAAEWRRMHEGDGLPDDLETLMAGSVDGAMATRASSGKALQKLAGLIPTLWGGSADLAGSNKTNIDGAGSFQKDTPGGRNLHFGIREHGMAAIMNGMALHGGVIPYGGTFLTFSDYMRGSMRLGALMERRAIYVLTHDSIFLGEDGPTHQSIEHAEVLRLIPNMRVFRPADARETVASWVAALRHTEGPSCLLLTRQSLPPVAGTENAMVGVRQGGYVVSTDEGRLDVVLIGTGSELHLCDEAATILRADGMAVRVVSMPSREAFEALDPSAQDAVIPEACPVRVIIEAGRTGGWEAMAGPFGRVIGIDRFGVSAPAEELAELFGITTGAVVQAAHARVSVFREAAHAEIARLQAALGEG